MSPRFYLFFSDVNQANEGDGLKRFPCVPAGMERHSSDFLRAVKNIVGCESVWNL